jgi:hypothetical protein
LVSSKEQQAQRQPESLSDAIGQLGDQAANEVARVSAITARQAAEPAIQARQQVQQAPAPTSTQGLQNFQQSIQNPTGAFNPQQEALSRLNQGLGQPTAAAP